MSGRRTDFKFNVETDVGKWTVHMGMSVDGYNKIAALYLGKTQVRVEDLSVQFLAFLYNEALLMSINETVEAQHEHA